MGPRVVVIGAGWAGLAAARTYLQLNPLVNLTILDDDTTVGGVWSSSRLYPGLVADSPRGLYEFSDLSMLDKGVLDSLENLDIKTQEGSTSEIHVHSMGAEEEKTMSKKEKYGLVTGEEVHNYLRCYAEKWDLLRRIRFGSRVVQVKRIPPGSSGWLLTLSDTTSVTCEKLIIASGLYSQPHIPSLPGLDTYAGLSLHSKSLGISHSLLSQDTIKSVTVVGSCKSALEAMNLCIALKNKPHINWIIRPSTYGVPIILNNPNMTISLLAANNTRLFSAMSPSIFDIDSFLYRFLHSGKWRLGTWLCAFFWSLMSWSILGQAGYDKSDQGKIIKPKTKNLFRSLLYVCLIHKGNPVLDEIHKAERITVHEGTPFRIALKGISIKDVKGDEKDIESDAIIWCTGWDSSFSFLPPDLASECGVPIPLSSQTPPERARWDDLDITGDLELLERFPLLRSYPLEPRKAQTTNFRMYRQISSPKLLANEDRSIVFTGFVSNAQTALCSEMMALWAVAWLEGLLRRERLPREEEMEMNVARTNAWMGRRYGSRGLTGPQIVIETQTYLDVLMRDLGLDAYRKKGWREWVGVYGAADYRGILEELLTQTGKS